MVRLDTEHMRQIALHNNDKIVIGDVELIVEFDLIAAPVVVTTEKAES